MRGWRAWYADGRVYSSLAYDWSDLPDDGVQAVRIYEITDCKPGVPYAQILDGKDWYYRAPNGRIEGVASDSWHGWRPKPCGVPERDIKRGTGMSDEAFARLSEEVSEARTWP